MIIITGGDYGNTNKFTKRCISLNMEQQLMEVAKEMFGKSLAELTDQETYYTVLAYARG